MLSGLALTQTSHSIRTVRSAWRRRRQESFQESHEGEKEKKMIAITYITLAILYTIACVMDGSDVKPLWKRWLGSNLEAQANKLKPINYCNRADCLYYLNWTPPQKHGHIQVDTFDRKHIEQVVLIGEDDLFRAAIRDGYCGGRSYGKSYEKELLIENAKEVCFDKLMEACKPFVEFKIMADEWKPGIHVCGAIEVGAKKRN